MRTRLLMVLLCLGSIASAAMAASPAPHRLADGTPVAEGVDYAPPVPEGGRMPLWRAAPGVQGLFAADLIVSPKGVVSEVIPVSRIHPQVDRTLMRRMRQVRFAPARLDGQPVAAIYRASIEFYTP